MFSYEYLLLIVVTLIIGCGATAWVNRQLHKYQRVPISNGLTGAEAARQMLAYYGIHNVAIRRGGHGQDFFDPRSNSVTLSPEAYDGRSITATATACHEVGHACQFAEGYAPMKVRGLGVFAHTGHLHADCRSYHACHHHVCSGGFVPDRYVAR